jgi:hypothetical protein
MIQPLERKKKRGPKPKKMPYFLDKPAPASLNESKEITSEVVMPCCSNAIESDSVPVKPTRKRVTRQQKRVTPEEPEDLEQVAVQEKNDSKRKKASVHGKKPMTIQPTPKLSKKSNVVESDSDF